MVDSGGTGPTTSAPDRHRPARTTHPGTAQSRRFRLFIRRTTLNQFLKCFGYQGRHRRMAIELPKSSAHLLPRASRALGAPTGNCYYVGCIAKRGSNDERRPRQTAGAGSDHRWLDIRQALRDELETDTL